LYLLHRTGALLPHFYKLVLYPKDDVNVNHPEFQKRELTLMRSRNATRTDFDHAISSMKNGLINPDIFITHRVGFDKVHDTLASWLNPANSVIKAMVTFE